MKSRDTALRLKRFEAEEKARKVADLQYMIRDFEQMANDLDRQIQAEEERTGIKDPSHFAYSTFAKSAHQRRENLRASVGELRDKLEAAQRDHEAALEQLTRVSADDLVERPRTGRRPDRTTGAVLR